MLYFIPCYPGARQFEKVWVLMTKSEHKPAKRGFDPVLRDRLLMISIIGVPLLLLVGYITYALVGRQALAKCPPDCQAANFSGADLRHTDQQWVGLRAATFFRAHLEAANFTGANLYFANLNGANLP